MVVKEYNLMVVKIFLVVKKSPKRSPNNLISNPRNFLTFSK